MKTDISIIVTARNYGKFLKECIDSCFNQTVKPYEVIYSDDFSDDNSIEIARSCGAKIIRQVKHVGVVIARNKGVYLCKGNILVHVDGDDILPPDFLQKHLETFDETTPFVYCAANAFGTFQTFWRVYPWKTLFLWNRNFVNTSAMIWKDSFLKAGAWQETSQKTMWDWSLAIRLTRLGTPRKSSAILNYRQHGESWSQDKEKADKYKNLINLTTILRRELVNMSIGLVYSGRIKGFLKTWMNCLVKDISLLNNKPQLIIVNNSETDISGIKKTYSKYFSEIRIITGEGKLKFNSEQERRNKVCELLAECYNIILENATGELIHLRESDIISPDKGFENLFNFITDGIPVKEAAAGIYFNRNPNWQKFVGGNFNSDNIHKTTDFNKIPSRKPFNVDFTGTGYLIFWKALCPEFKPYIEGIQAHDWSWGLDLKKQGAKIWMLPDVICKHYQDAKTFVQPLDKFEVTPFNNYTKVSSDIPKLNRIIKKIALNFKN